MSGLGYRICPVTPFVQNCSLIWCETTRQAAFVDPGGEVDRLPVSYTHLRAHET